MRLVWSPAAQDDVLDIAEYHDRFSPNLADFARLGEAFGEEGVRKRSVAGTPYVVLDDRVEVRRVVHVASDWRP